MSLLSISLDVCESTKIKNELSEFSGKHGTDLDKLYSELAKKMLISMNRFMELLALDDVLDIKRLFLVKRIGDEYWYVYELNGLEQHEKTRHATHMVQTLLAFFSKCPYDVVATSPEESDDPYCELEMPDDIMRKAICWKSTMELINHAIDLSEASEDKLNQFLVGLTSAGKKKGYTTVGDEEYIILRNRLGTGFSLTKPGKAVYAVRSDYIGLEVDRFFRLSKHAEKGQILAGKEFISLLMMQETATPGIFSLRDPQGGGSFTTALSRVTVKNHVFIEKDFKGFKDGYSGAYIFDDYCAQDKVRDVAIVKKGELI